MKSSSGLTNSSRINAYSSMLDSILRHAENDKSTKDYDYFGVLDLILTNSLVSLRQASLTAAKNGYIQIIKLLLLHPHFHLLNSELICPTNFSRLGPFASIVTT